MGRTDQNRIAGIEGGEFAQGAQQLGGGALKIGGIPAVRFATVDFGDDGQVIDVAERREGAQRAEAVAAFGFDGRTIEALLRQADVVGERVSGNIIGGFFRGDFTRGFPDRKSVV